MKSKDIHAPNDAAVTFTIGDGFDREMILICERFKLVRDYESQGVWVRSRALTWLASL